MDRDSLDKVTVTLKCPRGCGWYRSYRKQESWLRQIVDHPLYGPILEADLVQRDIQTHDCREYMNARIRLHTARRIREQAAA